MHVTSIFVGIVVAAALAIPDDEPGSMIGVGGLNITSAMLNSTEDKGFLEWLYQFLGVNLPVTTQKPQLEPQQPEKCVTCKCGLTNKHNRIVGGVETQVNQYPWMALLLYQGRFYCAGSVISSRYVLTAAHCVDRFQRTQMAVRILEHDRNSSSETKTQEFKVERVIKHGEYSVSNYNNDIALLKIDGIFKFDGSLRPVCLPDRAKTFAGLKGTVTGWGATEESGPISTTLQEVTVPILTNAECRATKYPARRITDNMLCAGFKEGNKDSCQGDSGGPLHVVNDAIHSVVGVVSWGEGCAKPSYPGIYARVNRYLTWLQRNTIDSCYC